MKTRNVFTLNKDMVTLSILDVTPVNGEKPENPKELISRSWELSNIPDELQDGDGLNSLKAYGLSSILQDRCSDMTDGKLSDVAGSVQEIAEARAEAYDKLVELFQSGQMRQARTSGAKAASVDSYFAEGFARFLRASGKEVDATTAAVILNKRSAEERKALRKHEAVAAYIAEAKADAMKAAGEIDIDSLL